VAAERVYGGLARTGVRKRVGWRGVYKTTGGRIIVA